MTLQAPAADLSEDLIKLIPQLRGVARSLCHNAHDADDAAQEALAKAWSARDQFKPGTNLRAWVMRILRNHVYSLGRREMRHDNVDPEVSERTLVARNDPDQELALNEVRQALFQLPKEQREVLVLVGAGGFPYEEVAEICGMPIGTVKSRVSRARAALAGILEDGRYKRDHVSAVDAHAAILSGLPELQEGQGLAVQESGHPADGWIEPPAEAHPLRADDIVSRTWRGAAWPDSIQPG